MARPEVKVRKPRPLDREAQEQTVIEVTGALGDSIVMTVRHRAAEYGQDGQLVASITIESGEQTWTDVYLFGECSLDDQRPDDGRIEKQ